MLEIPFRDTKGRRADYERSERNKLLRALGFTSLSCIPIDIGVYIIGIRFITLTFMCVCCTLWCIGERERAVFRLTSSWDTNFLEWCGSMIETRSTIPSLSLRIYICIRYIFVGWGSWNELRFQVESRMSSESRSSFSECLLLSICLESLRERGGANCWCRAIYIYIKDNSYLPDE